MDITNAVLRILTSSCGDCGITGDIIDMQSFACFPESPSHVTYRARLQGTPDTDSGSLISLIECWVDDGASIVVTGLLMKVDSKCSVQISSFNEGECSEIIPASTPDPTPSRKNTVGSTPGSSPSQKFNVDSTPDPTPSKQFTTPGPNDGPTDSTSDSTGNTVSPGAIIGGIVTVLVILIIAISVIIVVVLILKYRRGDSKKIK